MKKTSIIIMVILSVANNLIGQWNSFSGPIESDITSIAQQINGNNKSIEYVGTLKRLFISRGDFSNWESTTIDKWITDIIVNDTIIYASTREDGVYRSYNEGKNWEQINNGLTIKRVYDLSWNGSRVFAATSSRIYLSDDNGDNWTQINDIEQGVGSIANFNNRMFAISSGDIYYSNDYGDSWALIAAQLKYSNAYPTCVAMNESKVFVGTDSGIYISTDNGLTWYQKGPIHIINNLAVENDTVFFARSGGVFRSTSGGETWENVLSWGTTISKFSHSLLAGDRGGRIYYSADLGESWSLINLSKHHSLTSLVFDKSDIYMSNGDHIVYNSKNNGKSWNIIGGGIINYPVSTLFINQSGLYVGTGNMDGGKYPYPVGAIYFSPDNGVSWSDLGLKKHWISTLFAEGTNIYAGSRQGDVCVSYHEGTTWNCKRLSNSTIGFLLNVNSYVYTGTVNDGLFRSRDKGFIWYKINNISVECIATDGTSIYIGNDDGIFKSQDFGMTFFKIGNQQTKSIAISDNDIYISGPTGLFISYNGGSTWSNISTDGRTFQKIYIHDNYLYGYENGYGIYSISLSDIVVDIKNDIDNIPTNFSLEQNYPNPFNPNTSIRYSIPRQSFVTVKIYDSLGKVVKNLVQEYKPAGSYKVEFNATNLSSGIYFYQLNTADFTQTKKMILMK